MTSLLQDLRYAARKLSKSPGFTTAAIATFALGIGATTAIFSVVHAVLWSPLPFSSPDRLAVLWETDPHNESFEEGFSAPDFSDFRSQARSFSGMAAVRGLWLNLTEAGSEPERISADAVSQDFFSMLGVAPALGRGLVPSDDRPGAAGAVVLSDSLWRSRYGASGAVLGRSISLDGSPYTIVGVMPAGFDFPQETEGWIALEPALGPLRELRGVHNLTVFARLADGVTQDRAEAEVSSIAARLARQFPDDNAGRGARVQPLRDALVGGVRPSLFVLLGAVGLVTLISCANVSGLLLARAAARSREMAIRRALGAGRRRLLRLALTESALLALAGCAAGLVLAAWGRDALLALSPQALPRIEGAGLHLPVLLFSVGLSVAAGLLSGLAPALGTARQIERTLRRSDSRAAAGGSGRSVLVAGQIALACVLATGAGLLLRSFQNLHRVDPGFRAEGLLTARLQLPRSKYPEPSRDDFYRRPEVLRFYDDLLPRLRAIPGVAGAALAVNHPLREGWTSQVEIAGRPQQPGERDEVRIRPVSPDYFRTTGTPVLRGRPIEERDRQGSAAVIAVNEAFVRRYFEKEDPIGREVRFWGVPRQIVGVVRDVRFRGVGRPAEPAVYPSLLQIPSGEVAVLVRSRGDASSIASSVRQALRAAEPDVALFQIRGAPELIAESLAGSRFNATLLTLFGICALLLAAIGLYGLLAYAVERRTREIGIRSALGARRADLARMIVREGLARCLAGMGVGVLATLAATRLLAGLLYGVRPTDLVVFTGVFGTLLVVAFVASLLPARRASRVDPITALRAE